MANSNADAAVLRRAFWKASEICQGNHVKGWPPEALAAWKFIFDAVRDTQAGMDILQEIALLREDILVARADRDRLLVAIRNHRDQRGDDRCWLDDEALYAALPEGYTPPAREVAVELALCEKFIQCRRHPVTEYVSPQRMIEELEAEVKRLQQQIVRHCDQIAAQSELLSKRAMKPEGT